MILELILFVAGVPTGLSTDTDMLDFQNGILLDKLVNLA
jgi:hypothetical protein